MIDCAEILSALSGMVVREQVPLAQFSTLKVGGVTPVVVVPQTAEEVARIQIIARDLDVPLHIVSGGSNTLFSDEGFAGIVVKLAPTFDFIKGDENACTMTVGAATSFAKTTKLALSWGMSAALGWCGTPGLIGGATRMNAGTRMGEIKEGIVRVHGVLHGQVVGYDHRDIVFGYRSTSLPRDLIITEIELAKNNMPIENIDDLHMKVQEYRRKRRQTQPSTNSLGSFFTNPYPHFAAQLIEKCNLKGLEYKGAQISPLHANFLVNNGGATADDILYIASIAQQRVFDQFGVLLTPEVRMVGSFRRLLRQSSTKEQVLNEVASL